MSREGQPHPDDPETTGEAARELAADQVEVLRQATARERFLADVLENASMAFALGAADGTLLLCNRAFTELTGYSHEELCAQGLTWSTDLTPPEWRQRESDLLAKAARTGETVRYEKEYRKKDGSRVPIELLVEPVRPGAGELVHFRSFITDITGRKRAELEKQALLAAVSEEKERLAALVSSANDEIWFCDSDKRITLANPSAARAFRMAESPAADVEAFARSLEVLRADGSPRPAEEAPLMRALGGEVIRDEEEVIRTPAGGELRNREVSASPVKNAAGRIIGAVCVVRDITERRRSEVALREGHRRTAAILEGMTDAFYSLDDDWRFVTINPAAERAPFARPANELLGKVIWEIYPKLVGTPIQRHYLDAVACRRREHYEAKSPLDGRWYEVFMFPRPGGLDVYLRDIDDRKRAEEALRESEAKYRNLFQHMTEEVHFWRLVRDDDGRIITWRLVTANPPTLKTWNRTLAEIEGKTTDEIFGPGATEHYRAIVEKIMSEGRPYSYEDYFPNLDRHFRFTSIPLGDHFITTGADITATKKALQEVEAANARLTEDDQRKNEFLAVLSHELRNPLTPIRNSLYLLERAVPGSEQARRAQEVIARQSGQLARLVDDLLDVTRISRNKIQLRRGPLELGELVRRTVDDHRSLFEDKGIAIEVALCAERLPVVGDSVRLTQVVGNLLQNAAKFTPAGGRVTVTTLIARGRARLRVLDTGAGMEPAMVARLFQPFMQAETTLDRSKGGLGLGLSLVKGLVELHGGEVHAHSAGTGLGAEFVVELPLDPDAAAGPPPAPGVAEGMGQPRRVLIIEDNIDAADSLREALELGAHVVEVAYSGPEGLVRAREHKPEIVLCDLGLPGMDGFEVARAFRADDSLKSVILVALSGYALPEDLQRASAAGFAMHLAKPPSIEALNRLLAYQPAATQDQGERTPGTARGRP